MNLFIVLTLISFAISVISHFFGNHDLGYIFLGFGWIFYGINEILRKIEKLEKNENLYNRWKFDVSEIEQHNNQD